MSQFLICSRRPDGPLPAGIVVRSISGADAPAAEVAERYFHGKAEPQVVHDESGSAAPLVDAVWELQAEMRDVADCALVHFLALLVKEKIDFVFWCSCDFDELPMARTWDELMTELRAQASMQPADVYLRYGVFA